MDSSIDASLNLMEVEDPVIVDNDEPSMEAEEEGEEVNEEEEEDDEGDDEEEDDRTIDDEDDRTIDDDDAPETLFQVDEGDNAAKLREKLSLALNEIRRLKARKIAKEEETRKVRNRLARCRARLNTAEQSLTDIVAAGSKGRASAASPTTPLAPTKSSLVPWSDAEVAVLREAVADCGAGQWKLMHEKYKDRFHPVRTRINLRDRYKQLNAKNLW